MMKPQSIPWRHPLDVLETIDQPHVVLLYSGVQAGYSGRYSLLACDKEDSIEAADFEVLAASLSSDKPAFDNAWFGYLGYGLKDVLEQYAPDEAGQFAFPPLSMMRFGCIYHFDHDTHRLTLWSKHALAPMPQAAPSAAPLPPVTDIHSNMTRAQYLDKAAHIIECIHAGDLYQANLTRKFYGRFAAAPNPVSLFKKLCAVSPAPYSAFLRLGGRYILSSSPELFLRVDGAGKAVARPIKGTAPRSADPQADEKLRDKLAASPKDRAENLMIADLMRNDLSRSCIAGSISADTLFEVTTHATIHHMSSTISGQKNPAASTLDVIKEAFPPGSMTGAPKIHAVNLCSRMETQARGVYSGAIGWFGGDGSCDLSVVIRTLLLEGEKFEFQVGGGIVADSTPLQELDEIIEKSRGILAALGIGDEAIATL